MKESPEEPLAETETPLSQPQESRPLHLGDEENNNDAIVPIIFDRDDDDDDDKGGTASESAAQESQETEDISWGEVWKACCTHSPREWRKLALGIFLAFASLYVFMLGLEFISNGAKVMSGCRAGELFGEEANPFSSLMIGVLSTVLLQSSSTTTSIIVSLVGSVVNASQGIYMVMGANIGTSVTNTLVAMGQMGDNEQLERAFAGATIHDVFNFMSVAILFPLELATGYLEHLTSAMTKGADVKDGDNWEGPVKRYVAPVSDFLIIPNKEMVEQIAETQETCSKFYPLHCDPAVDPPTYDSCNGTFGLIACDSEKKRCPVFFLPDGEPHDDKVSGAVVFFMGVILIFIGLVGLVIILQRMLLGVSTRVIYKATDMNGYVAIVVGAGITMLVQSSSITTSTLTPLVGIGVLQLEQMYPLTLGANIGTTVTGIMAALVSDDIDSLRVALAHLMFNVTGIIIFYPIVPMRRVPLYCARRLGEFSRIWRGFPVVYVVIMFFITPLLVLALSALFEKKITSYTVLGSFIVFLLGMFAFYWLYWCRYSGGANACANCVKIRERERAAVRELPADMEYVMETLEALIEHTKLPVVDDDEESYDATATNDDALSRNGDEANHSA